MVKSTEGNNPRQSRRINRTLVLQLLRTHGRLSGFDLAKRSGLSLTATYNVVEELLAAGVLVEHGVGQSRGGRRPILYSLNPSAGYVVGVDVSGHAAAAESFSLCGDPVGRIEVPFEPTRSASILASVLEAVACVVRKVPGPLLGIGVGAPGLVDTLHGTVLQSANLGWLDLPLGQIVSARFRRPVIVDNDANVAALAESWYGAGRGYRSLVYVRIDTGIGAGMVLGGQLYRGEWGVSGELGHTTIDPDGTVCTCGRTGCLETIATVPAIIQRVCSLRGGAMTGNGPGFNEVVSAAYAGDAVARRVLREAGKYLGAALGNLVNLLSPAILVLAGRVAGSGPLLWEPMIAELRHRALSPAAGAVRVTRAELGDRAGIVGAATVVLEQVFSLSHEDWLPGLKPKGRSRSRREHDEDWDAGGDVQKAAGPGR